MATHRSNWFHSSKNKEKQSYRIENKIVKIDGKEQKLPVKIFKGLSKGFGCQPIVKPKSKYSGSCFIELNQIGVTNTSYY